MLAAPPVGSTRRCVVHRCYGNGTVVVIVDADDGPSDEPYVAVLDLDRPQHVKRGSIGILTRVDAGWRGLWRFDLATDRKEPPDRFGSITPPAASAADTVPIRHAPR